MWILPIFVLSLIKAWNKVKYMQVYAGELVVSGGSDNGETEVALAAKRCVELLNMLANI